MLINGIKTCLFATICLSISYDWGFGVSLGMENTYMTIKELDPRLIIDRFSLIFIKELHRYLGFRLI